MKNLFLLVAIATMLLPLSAAADNNEIKNGDFAVALNSNDVNPSAMQMGKWYIYSNRPSLDKYTIEPVEDAQNGNAVRIENTVDAAWYSHFLVQKVVLDADKGVYTLSIDAKADSDAPTLRVFMLDAVGEKDAIFVARPNFDPSDAKVASHSPAAFTRGVRGKKWKTYTFEFDASKFVNTFYSPNAAAKTGNSIEFEDLDGKNEFYVAIQVTPVGEAVVLDNVVLAPQK